MDFPYNYATNGFPYGNEAHLQPNPSQFAGDSTQTTYPHSFSGGSYAPSPPLAVPLPGYTAQGEQHENQFFTGRWVTSKAPFTVPTASHQPEIGLPTHIPGPELLASRHTQSSEDGLYKEEILPSRESRPPKRANVGRKIHACFMCTRSFDRPSTLKKHLVVHTRERPFSCEGCQRRFGHSFNLNRHQRTCRLFQGHSANTTLGTSATANSSSQDSHPVATASSDSTAETRSTNAVPSSSRTTGRIAAETVVELTVGTAHPSHQGPKGMVVEGNNETSLEPTVPLRGGGPRGRKRTRRAPTPPNWVPESLQMFDLTPVTTTTSVPLLPVRPWEDSDKVEERDSFDQSISTRPYHPQGWSGRLPGPGLLPNKTRE